MRRLVLVVCLVLALVAAATAVAKPRVISFGKPMTVKLFLGPNETKSMDIQIRALFVDGRLREFTTGESHDVTDKIFVVRRAYRVNDSLPEDERKLPRWRWQRGGWIMVDRTAGRITQLNLPEFDPFYSLASWYRDYVAYCGVSDDGEKLLAVVAQLGRKKPVLRRPLRPAKGGETPDSECAQPIWERQPMRVTFLPGNDAKVTFEVKGHAADLALPAEEEQ